MISPVEGTASETASETAIKANLAEQLGGQICREKSIGSGGAHGAAPTPEEPSSGTVAPKEPKPFPPREPPLERKNVHGNPKQTQTPRVFPTLGRPASLEH